MNKKESSPKNLPLVALESTVITHGLPYPQNIELASRLEAVVREEGGEPRTIGIIKGTLIAGLSPDDIRYLATTPGVHKVSMRDLPVVVAKKRDGVTTVATTMWIAAKNGIGVFSTGGIGGVHRGHGAYGTGSFDVSADLEELAKSPVTVVCAGAKAILDLEATLEYLETRGVTVIGYGTDTFPAFYSKDSGLPVDVRCDSPEEVAAIVRSRERLGLSGGTIVAVPIPQEAEIPRHEIDPAIEQALAEAREKGLRSAAITPFLLARLVALTGEKSLRANLALLENNARVATAIAKALQ